MALTNSGFDGTVTEAQWANMSALADVDAVESPAAWAVTQGTGRQVSTAAHSGHAFARGVLSKDTGPILTNLATPVNGQWFLIVRHIDWSTNGVSVVAVAHSTTTTTVPTAPPTTYPTVDDNPGVLYDQKLAWAWVRSTDTTVVVFDLRAQPLDVRVDAAEASLVDFAAGRTFRRFATWAAMDAVGDAVTNELAIVDAIPGAWFKYDGADWVMSGVARFADAAARTAAITAPAAGMRSILVTHPGIEWEYFGAYNSSTNPRGTSVGGVPTAGWFPVDGRLLGVLTITAGSIANSSEVTLGAAAPLWVEAYDGNDWHSAVSNTDRILPTIAGRYRASLGVKWAINATGNRLVRVRKSGTEVDLDDVVASASVSGNAPLHALVDEIEMNGSSDYFDFRAFQNSGGALAITARAVVEYAGPPVGP